MDVCKISFKNSILAIWNQLTRKGAWRNIFVTHNAFGIFSKYSHISGLLHNSVDKNVKLYLY